MPANVQTMFSVKQTPWHGIGHVLNDAPDNIETAIKLAGLDWQVLKEPLVTRDGAREVPAQAFVRSDNGHVLGVVGMRTFPLQNDKAFEFFQPFLSAGEAQLETAGSLGEGERVWVMAKIQKPNSEIAPGDEVAKYVLLSNSHDGTLAVRVGFTPVRVVCANTLAMAHADKASKIIRIKHSQKVVQNVENIRDTMNLANEEFEATAEQYRLLARKQINQADLRKYVKTVFHMEEDEGKMKTRTKNILDEIVSRHNERTALVSELLEANAMHQQEREVLAKNLLEQIVGNFEAGKGADITATRGTFWTAYNAVTEYLNHERGHNQDTRLNSLWFGDSAKVNVEALGTALEMVK